jgi:hypothetical protein
MNLATSLAGVMFLEMMAYNKRRKWKNNYNIFQWDAFQIYYIDLYHIYSAMKYKYFDVTESSGSTGSSASLDQ